MVKKTNKNSTMVMRVKAHSMLVIWLKGMTLSSSILNKLDITIHLNIRMLKFLS